MSPSLALQESEPCGAVVNNLTSMKSMEQPPG